MIVSEEAIAKGIRRIVAVTGAEAQKVSRLGGSWLNEQGKRSLICRSTDGDVAAAVRSRSTGLPPNVPSYLAEASHQCRGLHSYLTVNRYNTCKSRLVPSNRSVSRKVSHGFAVTSSVPSTCLRPPRGTGLV